MRLARILIRSSLALVVIACGGNVSGTDPGASSSGGSSSGGSSGGGSSGGGGACSSGFVDGDRACVPGTARANVPITLEVDAVSGCLGCDTTLDPCEVTVAGDRITLAMRATTCTRQNDAECAAVCMIPSAKCEVPPLAEGTYTVMVAGEGPRTGFAPRTLVVTANATETSCQRPQAGSLPEPLDGAKYARACSTSDECRLATVGSTCQPCACPNTAISKSAEGEYEADFRARSSQCPPQQEGIACAACAPAKAECEVLPDALVGTCKLVPGF